MISITIQSDKTKELTDALKKQAMDALIAIGLEAEGYAKDDCPVDTGRLRNSITFATKDYHSSGNDRWDKGAKEGASKEDTGTRSTPEDFALYLGTNVEYAEYVEEGDAKHTTGKKHFLRDAIATHGEHYKSILEASLRE